MTPYWSHSCISYLHRLQNIVPKMETLFQIFYYILSRFTASIGEHFIQTVSPAYGYNGSALVQCSNDGGPGPRHNTKGDPGSSIFNMLVWRVVLLLYVYTCRSLNSNPRCNMLINPPTS
jgi:hypothetical protein